jgi:hypothetical protein
MTLSVAGTRLDAGVSVAEIDLEAGPLPAVAAPAGRSDDRSRICRACEKRLCCRRL